MIQTNKTGSAMPSVYSDLPFGEQLVLWALRMWSKAFTQDANISHILREGFRLAGVPDAFGFLDSIMYVFATVGRGVLDIRCPACSEISIDEHRILGAIAVYQYGDPRINSDPYLRYWLRPTALRIIQEPTIKLANALKKGNLIIRPRPWTLTMSIESSGISARTSEYQTIH